MDTEELSSLHKLKAIEKGKALVEAAELGDDDEVLSLLRAGVSVNADEYNKSLFYASKNYVTPLQIASEKGNLSSLQILIEHGADVNARDRFDVTAVHMAAEKGNYLCLKELLDAGAESSLPTKHSKKGCYTAIPHLGGTTPLHLAAGNNQIFCVKELIQSGADYNAIDERGRTSLFIAAQANYDECVLAHLRTAIGRDILSLPGYETGDTPLHFAVRHGMVECIKELLNLGSDANHINFAGISPLHAAVIPNPETEQYCEEILKLLILDGFSTDINLPDGTGLIPLHFVCFNYGGRLIRRPNLARFLISYGADTSIKNQRGYSIIEYEFKTPSKDDTILKSVVQSTLHPPTLSSLKIFPPSLSPPPRLMPVNIPSFHSLYDGHDYEEPDRAKLRSNRGNLKAKYQWYVDITSKPRTLQHYCRFSIRNALGYRRLRHIKDLPIPISLQQYLLLKFGE